MEEAGTFAQALAALKRQGCGLLVVGMAPDTHVDVCRRLLGDAVAEPRRRLVVLAGSAAGAGERIDDDCGGEDSVFRILDRRGPTRSAATAAVASPPALDLQALSSDVDEAVEGLAPEDRAFESAELRVCLDSVGCLLEANGTDAVGSFLGRICDEVRARDGMFHAHLPLAHGNDRVAALAEPFDAVVEVRPGDQRWHLPDEGITTDWLSL